MSTQGKWLIMEQGEVDSHFYRQMGLIITCEEQNDETGSSDYKTF